MSRIANYASQQILNSYLQKVQSRIQDTQVQLTSEKRSQDYSGIGGDTQRLVGYEVDVQKLSSFILGNNTQDIFLQSTEVAVSGIEKTIKDFRTTLTSFNTTRPTDPNAIRTIQEQAFRALQSMQSYLNTEVNGRHIFSGNRADVAPVDLKLTTLSEFQAKFDGVNMSFPTTREAHLEDFNINMDSSGKTNWLTFTQDKDGNSTTSGISTITATTAQFANVSVGSHIEVTGTANNNGTYEVAAVTGGGTTIEIVTKMLTDETGGAALTKTGGTAINTSVTFNRSAGTIVAATTGALSGLAVGSSFTVSGTAQNNGTFIVESNNGTTLKIKEAKLVNEGTTASTVASLTGQDFTFTNATKTIAAGAGTPFSTTQPGMKVTIGGTTSNNGTFTVASVLGGGSSITVLENNVVDEAPVGANDTALITTATPTLDLVAQSFTFTNNASSFDTVDSGVAGSFSDLKIGMKITFGNTLANDGTYTVTGVSSDGKSISVLETLFTEAPTLNNDTAVVTQADGTVKAVSYYLGDTFARTQRVSKTQQFDIDLNAIDPAFEKAIRAMSLIAQGQFGTAGGLEQTANANRVVDAVNLIDLSLKFNSPTNPKYEAGATGSIEQAFVTMGYQRSLIETANTEHTRLIGFFESRVSDLENINQLDVITRLLDDQNALQASYKAMSTIRGLSLQNFL